MGKMQNMKRRQHRPGDGGLVRAVTGKKHLLLVPFEGGRADRIC